MANGKWGAELGLLDRSEETPFMQPKKMINEPEDVSFFLTSKAYADIMTFLLQLNVAMFPHTDIDQNGRAGSLELPSITALHSLISTLADLIDEAPPDPGPRRFGNVSFRKWFSLVESNVDNLLNKFLPPNVLHQVDVDNDKGAIIELRAYILGSFGSVQRLDYGTGHELCFLVFLGCIWKLGGFPSSQGHEINKAIVVGVIKPYLDLVRRLILTYNLEPAGSHGVWGLDDHAFIPYIFGSAQLSPPVHDGENIPLEGSGPDAPSPGEVANPEAVNRLRTDNMYFDAIGFIYDVKKGPFWEHSPMLYDISGVKAGWAKINKGMVKMYMAEVLAKFPVVQHFTFGAMFKWERDPKASVPPAIPAGSSVGEASPSMTSGGRIAPKFSSTTGTTAPWASRTVPRKPSETVLPKR